MAKQLSSRRSLSDAGSEKRKPLKPTTPEGRTRGSSEGKTRPIRETVRRTAPTRTQAATAAEATPAEPAWTPSVVDLAIAGLLLLATGFMLFGTDFSALVEAWIREEDYSHGFLVIPMALVLLWMRRDSFPEASQAPAWFGLILLGAALMLRFAGHMLFLGPLLGWGMVLWIAGSVWLLCGLRIFLWALPGIVFLLFMVPLPFRAEQLLATPLRSIATSVSTYILQVFGQPAVAEGNIIRIGDNELEVAQACSGLRMLVSIAAVTYIVGAIVQRAWWEKALLALCILPVAILANSLRIASTGFAYQFMDGETARHYTHDIAGYLTIPLAGLILIGLVTYWTNLVMPVAQVKEQELIKQQARRAEAAS